MAYLREHTMDQISGKAVIAQGGGPTAVINQSLVGAVLQARRYPHITNFYGAVGGVEGLMNENFIDLTQASTHNLEVVARTPGAGLLSSRKKPTKDDCARIFEVLKAHDIHYFFYIGGNDSAETCRIVNKNAIDAGYDLRVIHIPKTIDNDIKVTDHCPGYGSAARFVAQAFAGINQDNRSLPGVYIGIVMGRHAGIFDRRLDLRQEIRQRRPPPDLPAGASLLARRLYQGRGRRHDALRPVRRGRIGGDRG